MAKSSVRRRKSKRQEDNEAVSKDTVVHESSNGGGMMLRNSLSATIKSPKRPFKTLLLVFLAVFIVIVLKVFRGDSTLHHGSDENGNHHHKDAAHESSVQHKHHDAAPSATSSTARDTSMDGPAYQVLQVLPHDSFAFTQGLSYWKGNLYESTGYHGKSQVRRINATSGEVTQSYNVSSKYFGEGIAHFTNKEGVECLIQLTWQEQVGFVYRMSDFSILQTFNYTTSTNEGWGITYNPTNDEFIISDGSHYLHFWDASALQEKRRVAVTFTVDNKEHPVNYLNELEYDTYTNTILANVWYNNNIVRINPTSGVVEKVYNFQNLYRNRPKNVDCFNGIALSDVQGELYVTGKWWPKLYRVRLLEEAME